MNFGKVTGYGSKVITARVYQITGDCPVLKLKLKLISYSESYMLVGKLTLEIL